MALLLAVPACHARQRPADAPAAAAIRATLATEDSMRVHGSRCPIMRGVAESPVGAPVVTVGDSVSGDGLICYFTIEGGFYAIIGTDRRSYDPINLSAALRRDSLPVTFRARIRHRLVSVHRVRPMVELVDIRERRVTR